MELRSLDGVTSVRLFPIGYQFPGMSSEEDVWDRNWLNIRGNVACPEGEWSFVDACMVTWDAQEVASWLRRVADREEPCGEPASDDSAHFSAELVFLEPNLAFGVEAYLDDEAIIGIVLSHESAPPWLDPIMDFEQRIAGYRVRITIQPQMLRTAADDWDRENLPYLKRAGR